MRGRLELRLDTLIALFRNIMQRAPPLFIPLRAWLRNKKREQRHSRNAIVQGFPRVLLVVLSRGRLSYSLQPREISNGSFLIIHYWETFLDWIRKLHNFRQEQRLECLHDRAKPRVKPSWNWTRDAPRLVNCLCFMRDDCCAFACTLKRIRRHPSYPEHRNNFKWVLFIFSVKLLSSKAMLRNHWCFLLGAIVRTLTALSRTLSIRHVSWNVYSTYLSTYDI